MTTNHAIAIDFGWQELPGGGIEYLVQVEPTLVDSFKQGGFQSDIPPGLRDIRRIHIVVGEEKLPNQGNLDGPKVARNAQPPVEPTPNMAATTGDPVKANDRTATDRGR